jgi:8-amino-7-oxononanoate synthase
MLSREVDRLLKQKSSQSLYRTTNPIHEEGIINFCSNDYLSLSLEPDIKKAYQEGVRRYAVGSTGSMVVSGYHKSHQALEEGLCAALNTDRCLLFSSGYNANLSILLLLKQLNAHVVMDKQVHASIYDGIQLSKVEYSRYKHQDNQHLQVQLQKVHSNKAVLTESTFSMSGQTTDLKEVSTLCKQYQAELIVDEAHGFGLVGNEGLGGIVRAGLSQDEVPLRLIPFGKTLASTGAAIVGQHDWIEALLQCARPAVYSTALSPAIAHGVLCTLGLVRRADDRREKLNLLIRYFNTLAAQSTLTFRLSNSPIQQLQLGHADKALYFGEELLKRGIMCTPIRRPTVSQKETGLRIILNHNHDIKDVQYLFHALEAL